jgi:hypothetical protein
MLRNGLLKARHAAVVLILGLPCNLHAEPALELQLDAPVGCPGQLAILAAASRLAQKPPEAPLNARAKFTEEAGHWVLDVSLEQGQRRVTGDTCVAVAEALVVILALAVDPTAKLSVATFPELERPAVEPPTIAPVPRSELRLQGPWTANPPTQVAYSGLAQDRMPQKAQSGGSVPSQPNEPARFGLSLSMLAETGALPSWSLGPSIAVRYGTRGTWGEVSINRLAPRWAPSTQDATKGGNISWSAAEVSGCFAPLYLGGCLGAELGELVGTGRNVSHSQTAIALWPAVSATAVMHTQLRAELALEARLGFAIPALRPEFGLHGYGGFFHSDWVSLRAYLGFLWR